MLLNLESPVTTAHRAKLAYIYVRQSTAGQVRQHQESTELQYRLVDRAALFGWPKERIEVIDDVNPVFISRQAFLNHHRLFGDEVCSR